MLEKAKRKIFNNYTRLPPTVGRILLHLPLDAGMVYGRGYREYTKFLIANRSAFAPEQLLVESVIHAIKNVPWYRERYGGKNISTIAQFEESVGFIDKDVVLANFNLFIDPTIDLGEYDTGTTGGTSGKALKLIAPKTRYVVEMATMHSLWARAGYRFDVRAVIRNHHLDEGQHYVINPVTREVIFDGFRLNDDYFRILYQTIRRMGIRFVHCYPSTAYEFATFLQRNKMDTSFIAAFLSGSENIFDYQRELIENTLGIRFYNWYGHSEKLVLAGYCSKTHNYHVEPTYGYFELVDDCGKVIREPGGVGEIVGTSFHNPGMPFIRYRTGDFAEYVGDRCEACGRRVPILRNIRGRWSGDRIYKKDGTFVTTTALNLHSELYSMINGLQYVQEKKGEVAILIVKSAEYTEQHEAVLYDHFRKRLGEETHIEIRYVDRLLRKPNGKFVQLISTVTN